MAETYPAPTETSTGELTLVLGVDGSGKSTFLQNLTQRLRMRALEQTTSQEAKTFKALHVATPVDLNFVNERESLYLKLNGAFEASILDGLSSGQNIVTSGGKLITLVSHQLMRTVIGEDAPDTICNTVEEWLGSDALKPDKVVLIHAPHTVIRQRIAERQQSGDNTEVFWGFNAPFFLDRYQDSWHQTISILGSVSTIPCLELDSSLRLPDEMIDIYMERFEESAIDAIS